MSYLVKSASTCFVALSCSYHATTQSACLPPSEACILQDWRTESQDTKAEATYVHTRKDSSDQTDQTDFAPTRGLAVAKPPYTFTPAIVSNKPQMSSRSPKVANSCQA